MTTMSATRHRLTGNQITELRQRLEAARRRLLDLYQDSVERAAEIPHGEAEDLVDRAAESWEKEEIYAEREGERARLLLVEEALDRLAGGTYGTCLFCGTPIGYARLLAVPATRYCARHQQDVERRRIDERRPHTWPAPAAAQGTES